MDPDIIMTDEERRRLIESIPQIGDVDACKENIQPRRKGRSIAALRSLFETTPTDRESMLKAGHCKFEEEIASLDEQDDPLQTYLNYIEWTIQMYPQGQTADSNLIGLLRDATDKFKNDRRYKHDPRYLKIWIEYANCVNEPKEIFLYLMKQGIGQTLTLFYEEYADYYEKLNKFEQATQVYELGIREHADPIKRLQKSFSLFKARTEEKRRKGLVRKRPTESSMQMESLRATGQRTMLGQKFESQSSSSFSANVFSGLESRYGNNSSGIPTQIHTSRSFGNDQSSLTTAPSFSVFVEPPTTKSSSSITPSLPSTPSVSLSRSNSLHITPSSSSRTENQRPIEKFTGSTLPQRADLIRRPSIEKFEVYIDPEVNDEEQPRRSTLDRSSSMLSVLSTDSESPISRLRKHPLPNEQNATKRLKLSESYRILESRFKKNKHRYIESPLPRGGVQFTAILKSHDMEMSFEEVRAKRKTCVPETSVQSDETDGFSTYLKETKELDNEVKSKPDLTTQTLLAKQSLDRFESRPNYTQDEEDLTWNRSYQAFDEVKRPTTNENE